MIVCRVDDSPIFTSEQKLTSDVNSSLVEKADIRLRPSTNTSTVDDQYTTISSMGTQTPKKFNESNEVDQNMKQQSFEKVSLTQNSIDQLLFESMPYNHDVLVIETQPIKVNVCVCRISR
jgi:hypothetical protein